MDTQLPPPPRPTPADGPTAASARSRRADEVGELVASILRQAEEAAERIEAVADDQAVSILAITEDLLSTFEHAADRLRAGRDELAQLLARRTDGPSGVDEVTTRDRADAPPYVVEEWRGWPDG